MFFSPFALEEKGRFSFFPLSLSLVSTFEEFVNRLVDAIDKYLCAHEKKKKEKRIVIVQREHFRLDEEFSFSFVLHSLLIGYIHSLVLSTLAKEEKEEEKNLREEQMTVTYRRLEGTRKRKRKVPI